MNIDIKSVRSIAATVPGERTRTLMLLLCDEIEKLREERSKVVAYLRRETYPCCGQCNNQLADWIERGDHHLGTDE